MMSYLVNPVSVLNAEEFQSDAGLPQEELRQKSSPAITPNTNIEAKELLQLCSLQHKAFKYHSELLHKQQQHLQIEKNDERRNKVEPRPGFEADIVSLVTSDFVLIDSNDATSKYLDLLPQALTENDRACAILVLGATTKRIHSETLEDSKKRISKFTEEFEMKKGVHTLKNWLTEATACCQFDFIVMMLEVLQNLPINLKSITDAEINKPIVKMKKKSPEERVKKAAQELLKLWKGKFTKPAPSSTSVSSSPISAPSSSLNSRKISPSTRKSSPTEKKVVPFSSKSKGKDVLGNVLKAKTPSIKRVKAKESSSIKIISTKPKDNIPKENKPKENKRKDSKQKETTITSTTTPSSTVKLEPKSNPTPSHIAPLHVVESPKLMALPTIKKFGEAAPIDDPTRKKIRWADESGKELVKVKFIESWRDQMHHHDGSFSDAKKREHENERNLMLHHKQAEQLEKVTPKVIWKNPPFVIFPETLTARNEDCVETEEMIAQTNRTKGEMETIILKGETTPMCPKEWAYTAEEMQYDPPLEVPLTDGTEPEPVQPQQTIPQQPAGPNNSQDDSSTLLDHLERQTVASLLENEAVLPFVYEEAQRNGGISDARVYEIIKNFKNNSRVSNLNSSSVYTTPNTQNNQTPYNTKEHNMTNPPNHHHRGQEPNFHSAYQPLSSSCSRGITGGSVGDRNMGFNKRNSSFASQQQPPLKRRQIGPSTAGGRNLPLCSFIELPSGCRLGNNCKFSHQIENFPNRPMNSSATSSLPSTSSARRHNLEQTQVCGYFSSPLGCRLGSNCKFIHQTAPATTMDSYNQRNASMPNNR